MRQSGRGHVASMQRRKADDSKEQGNNKLLDVWERGQKDMTDTDEGSRAGNDEKHRISDDQL